VILVDTSVWVDHLRRGAPRLVDALDRGDVLAHPFVIGELACLNLKNRAVVLRGLSDLPAGVVATDDEVLHLIENRGLAGKGIGYVDAHLLASVILSRSASLWTLDRRLAAIAASLQVAFEK